MNTLMLEAAEVLRRLHKKFAANFDQALAVDSAALEQVDIKARALAECGAELAKDSSLTTSQLQLTSAAEEVFADIVASAYLASVGLDRYAQMVLRRAFELGLAIIYLWDLPHLFWGWKDCDHDLSFSEMLEHLGSLNYRTFLIRTACLPEGEPLIDETAAKRIYRTTSDTIHGKVTTHKVLSGDGFVHNGDLWKAHLILIDESATLLLNLWFKRFPNLRPAVCKALPTYDRISR